VIAYQQRFEFNFPVIKLPVQAARADGVAACYFFNRGFV
jgi:hypothetical protein